MHVCDDNLPPLTNASLSIGGSKCGGRGGGGRKTTISHCYQQLNWLSVIHHPEAKANSNDQQSNFRPEAAKHSASHMNATTEKKKEEKTGDKPRHEDLPTPTS